MKINLIRKQTVLEYIDRHASGRKSFEFWLTTLKYADWNTPEDILRTFGSADLLGNGSYRVVFNIGGNNYRLIAKYHFADVKVQLFIKLIGTHTEYDELCSHGEQHNVDAF